MHDIDRTQLEFEADDDTEFEFEFESFDSAPYAREATVFDDADEMELAAELLSVSEEAELDQFLGKLINKAGKALGKAVKGPVGQKLGGFLKGAVKKVVPAAASVAGGLFGGPVGAAAAGKIASAATKAFGMELEGMSTEDQEFESARRFVRFAGEAARQASRLAGSTDPQDAAHKAVVGAAKRFAPGLVRPALRAMHGEVGPGPIARGNHSGRWVRQGEKIVLMGL